MCNHVFCLPCILKKFAEGKVDTYLEECPECTETIFFAPRPEVQLNVITSQLRLEQGMQAAPVEPIASNPFEAYLI